MTLAASMRNAPRQAGQASLSAHSLSAFRFFGSGSACIASTLLDRRFRLACRVSVLARRATGELALDPVVCAGLRELMRYADTVEDGIVVGRPVADDADAAPAKQRSAAVLGVVEPPAELVESPP